jgi:hypothetical protein
VLQGNRCNRIGWTSSNSRSGMIAVRQGASDLIHAISISVQLALPNHWISSVPLHYHADGHHSDKNSDKPKQGPNHNCESEIRSGFSGRLIGVRSGHRNGNPLISVIVRLGSMPVYVAQSEC